MFEQSVEERLSRGMTPHPSHYLVLEARHDFKGARYNVSKGERRTIRFGYEGTKALPSVVLQARAGQPIDWGGFVCSSMSYAILFDGVGPLPAQLKRC